MITLQPLTLGPQTGTLATRPAAGRFTGDLWWSSGTNTLYLWNGAAWVQQGLVGTQNGFALQNATPNILGLTAPNDGRPHAIIIGGGVNVTVAETGGAVGATYTIGGGAQTLALDAGGHGAGFFPFTAVVVEADPNTVVNVNQTSALTAGAGAVYLTTAVI